MLLDDPFQQCYQLDRSIGSGRNGNSHRGDRHCRGRLATLQGYFSWRKCVQAIAGCALIFGAPAIARSFMDMTAGAEPPIQAVAPIDHPPLAMLKRPPQPYDPYAGASVPQ